MPRGLATGVAEFSGLHVANQCLQSGFQVVGMNEGGGRGPN
jgi:hypothetical protein